jgi:TPR repeat protein
MIQHKDFFPLLKLRAGQEDSEAEYAWAGLLALGFGGIMLQGQAFITEAQGLSMLKKASGRGHLPSMIELGLCYYAGRWVAQDQDAGVDLWRQAARGGSREAEIRIAVTTVRGERRDTLEDKHALEILQGAVQGGSVLAEMALGYCYDNGVGVPRITAVADRFYRAAARRGSQDAFRALKLLYDRIRPGGAEFVIL